MSSLPPLPRTPPGRYRHYKGGEYEVMGVARHSETREPVVIYRPLYNDSGWWARDGNEVVLELPLRDGA